MSAPTCRILSALDPADHSCTAWFTVNGVETSMRFPQNTQAHEVKRLIDAAYKSGMRDGANILARDIYRDLKGSL